MLTFTPPALAALRPRRRRRTISAMLAHLIKHCHSAADPARRRKPLTRGKKPSRYNCPPSIRRQCRSPPPALAPHPVSQTIATLHRCRSNQGLCLARVLPFSFLRERASTAGFAARSTIVPAQGTCSFSCKNGPAAFVMSVTEGTSEALLSELTGLGEHRTPFRKPENQAKPQ